MEKILKTRPRRGKGDEKKEKVEEENRKKKKTKIIPTEGTL
jgi:hypothetical protein